MVAPGRAGLGKVRPAAKLLLPDMDQQITSKKRVADHGEVFTRPREVNAMLDLVAHECERIDSRFLEPALGNGGLVFRTYFGVSK